MTLRTAPTTRQAAGRVAGLARHNVRLWLANAEVPIVLVGMPLALMVFLRPVYREALRGVGIADATGAEQAVPGMAVMFALLAAGILATDLHREQTWGTWQRLRASGARTGELAVGKLLPPLAILAGQLAVLFAAGASLLGLRVQGSVIGLVLVAAAFAIAMLALGLALSSLVRSMTALSALGNALSVGLAGLGGAIVPVAAMPAWAALLAPLTPSYWAMRGFQAAILDQGGLPAAAGAALVITGFAVALGALAAWRFRAADA